MKLLVTLSLLAVALAGCTTDEPGFTTPPTDAEGRYVIEMTSGNRFVPARAEVPANATIVFQTTGGVHDVWSDSSPKAWQNSPNIRSGEEFEVTLEEPGDYPYHCEIHKANGMEGTIRVTAE